MEGFFLTTLYVRTTHYEYYTFANSNKQPDIKWYVVGEVTYGELAVSIRRS